ncbi:uncharacterized protein A1O9_05356 [Exophiala aquamarina CBS 119918]|uniref:RING-CH-type domain-containing protein n=1 Tax=Exophiala aquamarina CBS 119918 TaxID=1182545 RepID=A0A072PBG1_9EURO|nr:uncharacterized protein A1O9_05356 [Exophiala aquamarina CBS 119918]KEF57439.1 hypothetical protein A1O9_05356 [Exophiala aquamarina CBS 119918]
MDPPLHAASSSWTYPTRTCRYCLEDVPATVTLYPPGLPVSFQRPVVEYKNDDEYGRLIKPCLCKGGMRYVHELCLRRARTESQREGSLWKCHQCGYQFSFNRLTLQKYLGSKPVSGALTVLVMILVMFLLGFIADPILNIYTDPYDTLMRHEDMWERVEVNQAKVTGSGWGQHFVKGLVSMGVLSFLRSMVLNPFHWINLRNTGFFGGRSSGRSTTGRDRALNVSWVMVAFGVITAFYLFYKWVQAIISRYLQRIGNNIVDTQLPGDDDDLKPPPNFKFEESYPDLVRPKAAQPGEIGDEGTFPPSATTSENRLFESHRTQGRYHSEPDVEVRPTARSSSQPREPSSAKPETPEETLEQRSVPGNWESAAYSSALGNAHTQGWSFRGLQ